MDDRLERYLVVGAGAAGLTAAKNLKQMGIPVDVIEREDSLGGIWNYGKSCSAVYRSLHMVSSKRFSEYTDFPIPDHLPTYLPHRRALEYLQSYALRFDLMRHIEFGQSVEKAAPLEGGEGWEVRMTDGSIRLYAGLLVATGHLWRPSIPQFKGHFHGTILHSSRYKTPDILAGKRVLVLGGGNSGSDIAVESSTTAEKTFLSLRRGHYFWPKFVFGMPSDAALELALKFRVPLWLRRLFGHMMLRVNTPATAQSLGLPKPGHGLYGDHFTLNSTLLYAMAHGDIAPKPGVTELRGDKVLFEDGSEEEVDVIVCATGFHLMEFPFLDKADLQWTERGPRMFMQMFHPARKNLFLIGFFQTSTGNWPIMDYQSQLVARYICARRNRPGKARQFERMALDKLDMRLDGGIGYYQSHRHAIQVEHFSFRNRLKKWIRFFSDVGSYPAEAARPARVDGRYAEAGIPA